MESPFCVPLWAGLLHGNASWGQIPPSGRLGLEVGHIDPMWREIKDELVPVNLHGQARLKKIDATPLKKTLITEAAERCTERVTSSVMKQKLY